MAKATKHTHRKFVGFSHALHKICKNTGFPWHLFSDSILIREGSVKTRFLSNIMQWWCARLILIFLIVKSTHNSYFQSISVFSITPSKTADASSNVVTAVKCTEAGIHSISVTCLQHFQSRIQRWDEGRVWNPSSPPAQWSSWSKIVYGEESSNNLACWWTWSKRFKQSNSNLQST